MALTQDPSIDIELPIAQPPDAVWAALTNWEAAGSWFRPGIDRVEAPADGTRNLAMVQFHIDGKVLDCSIQDCEPSKHLNLVNDERGVLTIHGYTLRRLDDGNTALRLRVDVAAYGLSRLWKRGIEKRVLATDREQLDRFKAHIERP